LATFEAQVEALTGITISSSSTNPTQAELDQFLADGVLDVTDKWLIGHPQDRELFMDETDLKVAQGANLDGAEIISVVRADGITAGNFRPCRKISQAQQSQVLDTESLSFASKYHPVYMLNSDNSVAVFPVPSDNSGKDSYKIYYVNNTPKDGTGNALTFADSTLRSFPADKVYLVSLYASIKSLHANMVATTISDLAIKTVPPDTPTITASTVSFSSTAPTYTAPTTNINLATWATVYPDQYTAVTIAWTAINAEIDQCLTIADDMHEQLTSAEAAYDKFRADGGDPALFGDQSTYDTANSEMTRVKDALDNAKTIIDDGANSPTGNAAGDAATYLYTDQDTELLQGAISIASSEIQRANAHLAEWNATVQSLNVEGQGFLATSQGFGAEIQSKLGIANSYIAEVSVRLSNVQPKVAEYQVRIQDSLNEFNEVNAAYQAELQISIQNAQLEDAEEAKKLQKYVY